MSESINNYQFKVGGGLNSRLAKLTLVPQATAESGEAAVDSPPSSKPVPEPSPRPLPAASVSEKVPADVEVSRFPVSGHRRKHIQSLAQLGMTLGEIAALLGTSAKKFSPKNRRDFRRGRAQLQKALRRQQLAMAAGEDPDLRLIFMLGKEYLKQGRDKPAGAGSREPEKTYLNVRLEDV